VRIIVSVMSNATRVTCQRCETLFFAPLKCILLVLYVIMMYRHAQLCIYFLFPSYVYVMYTCIMYTRKCNNVCECNLMQLRSHSLAVSPFGLNLPSFRTTSVTLAPIPVNAAVRQKFTPSMMKRLARIDRDVRTEIVTGRFGVSGH